MNHSKKVDNKFNFLKPIKFAKLVRLGKKYDGGYVVPEELIKNSEALISFGYGYDPSFEYDYIKRNNKSVYIYDYSCGYVYLIKKFLKYLKRFLLFRKKLKDVIFHCKNLIKHSIFVNNKNINFYKKKIVPANSNNAYKSENFISSHSAGEIPLIYSNINVGQIFSNIKSNKIIFKCDIEGSEYEIVDEILKHQDRIDVMAFEFHWVDKNTNLFVEKINKILNFFSIVHIHGNNHLPLIENANIPIVPEITFVNNKYIKEKDYITNFPIKNLDNPNNPFIEDLHFYFE